MKRFVAQIRSAFRPGDPRRKVLLWALFVSILCGVVEFGAPIETSLRVARNHLRAKPVSGDIVVVGIDNETLSALGTKSPGTGDLAKLVRAIDRAGASRIFVDFPTDVTDGSISEHALASALSSAKAETFLTAQENRDALTESESSALPATALRKSAKIVSTHTNSDFLEHVWQLPYRIETPQGSFPSMAAQLASIPPYRGQSDFFVDYSFDPRTIPITSGSALLNGSGGKQVAGKTVVLTPVIERFGTVKRWPGYFQKPRALVSIVGAETLRQGTPTYWGWMPILGIMVVCCSIQLATRRWLKKSVILLGATFVGLVPFLAESRLVFLDVAPALIFFTWIAFWDIWSNFGKKLQLTNQTSGLANLNALNEADRSSERSLVVALVRNYAHVRSSVPEALEGALVKQISDRLALGAGGSKLYQADDGSFAWFVEPGLERELDTQFEALHALFRTPVVVAERQIDLDIAFGVDRNFGRSAPSRYSSAWIAATEAGNLGLKWKGFDAAKLENAEWQLSMLGQLDSAIDNGEVWVAYQPQLDVKTNRIIGAEALVRWSHPVRGEIGPDEFIGTAEQHNRIGKLTDFVLDQAISAAAAINASGSSFIVSVNLSPKLLEDAKLVDNVASTLKRRKLPPALLTLELTETVAIDKNLAVLETLEQLRNLGVRISIDDYGTGFSTLEYLKRVPAGEIKIDRSFIRQLAQNESDQLVVRSTIDLAHSLGCRVVAEGVETEGVLAMLQAMNCDSVQGYLIGPPMQLQRLLERIPARTKRAAAA